MRKTGPSNPVLQDLIQNLRKEAATKKAGLWRRVADDLEKSTRQRRAVNLSRIARFTKPDEVVVVPGKVLGSGALSHSVTVAAFAFSDGARKGISDAKGKAIPIDELMKKHPNGKDIRIIG